jgi:hypothetical protein
MMTPVQLEQIKASVDLLDLASHYTELKKIAACEYAGPCPQCAGKNRFHVHISGWWFCRKCHPKRSDAIGLVQFIEGCGFVAACERLGARGMWPRVRRQRPTPKPKPTPAFKPWRSEAWQAEAQQLVDRAVDMIERTAGAAGRTYLLRRGIEAETWRAWRLGYGRDRTGQWGIVLPWLLPDGRITAMKYRRLQPKTDDARFCQKRGGEQLLFGAHLIDASARTLVLVEGELNALSIWQTCRDLGLAVVSFGGESATKAIWKAGQLARTFGRVLVWCDKAERARAVLQVAGRHAQGIQSPKTQEAPHGLDANDLLQRGLLRAFMERKLGLDQIDPTALIAHNRMLIRQFLARAAPEAYLPASLLAFDRETPVSELQAIKAQLEALLAVPVQVTVWE